MTLANTDRQKDAPWFAKAGAACSIIPISRFVSRNIFALKSGGYGCLFALAGMDEESLTDQDIDARIRSIEGALRSLPVGSCLYQYSRAIAGYELPRQNTYRDPVTQAFVDDLLAFLSETAAFRRIDLHWCLTIEPSTPTTPARKAREHAADSSRMLTELMKIATILEGHLSSLLSLRLLEKNTAFQFLRIYST